MTLEAMRTLANNFRESVLTEKTYTGSFDAGASSVGSKITSSEYIINLLNTMEKKGNTSVNVYKEIVRFLIYKFNNMVYINYELELVEVRCKYGNPERTIAKLTEHDNHTLPLITISQNSIVEANDRRRNKALFTNETIWDEEKQKAQRVIGWCDRPVTIQYNLNIWAKYMEDLDQLAQKVRTVFNPNLTLKTAFTNDSPVFLESEDNNYSFTLADREDRILRKAFTLNVETYIKSPKYKITSTGKMEEINVEGDIY